MRIRARLCLCVAIVTLIAAVPALAKTPPKKPAGKLPTAESVLDRYVEVTGGKDAYASVKSEEAHGTMEMGGMPAAVEFEMYWAAPSNLRQKMTIPMLGAVELGVHDAAGWQRGPGQPAHALEGQELASALDGAKHYQQPAWRSQVTKVRLVGIDTVEAQPAYRIERTEKGGRLVTEYYNVASGLLMKKTEPGPVPGTPERVESYSDYRKTGALTLPYRMTTVLGPQTMTTQLTSRELNATLPPGTFDMPAEEPAPPATKQ